MKKYITFLILAISLSVFMASPFVFAEDPVVPQADAPAAPRSLYERLGGEAGITAVVEDFVARTAANPAVNFTRQGQPKTWEAAPENIAVLKKRLVQFVSVATGSVHVIYEGKDMKTAHTDMKISNAEFDALAGDLKASLEKLNVPAAEQEELLAIAGTTRGQIVEEDVVKNFAEQAAQVVEQAGQEVKQNTENALNQIQKSVETTTQQAEEQLQALDPAKGLEQAQADAAGAVDALQVPEGDLAKQAEAFAGQLNQQAEAVKDQMAEQVQAVEPQKTLEQLQQVAQDAQPAQVIEQAVAPAAQTVEPSAPAAKQQPDFWTWMRSFFEKK